MMLAVIERKGGAGGKAVDEDEQEQAGDTNPRIGDEAHGSFEQDDEPDCFQGLMKRQLRPLVHGQC
ncbi:MAG: hypothetical protein B9S32_16505 [Verrucomicrobia bacterium Tous-C9LFEB]|nr:MAG: hypothetical protein B9S32_16505 [Verrucomicrobia bacterium Tous-C9LFEB]